MSCGTTNTVNQAGLFNSTTAGATSSAFTLKNFPSSIAINTNDQLTVNWDITIDGTDLDNNLKPIFLFFYSHG